MPKKTAPQTNQGRALLVAMGLAENGKAQNIGPWFVGGNIGPVMLAGLVK